MSAKTGVPVRYTGYAQADDVEYVEMVGCYQLTTLTAEEFLREKNAPPAEQRYTAGWLVENPNDQMHAEQQLGINCLGPQLYADGWCNTVSHLSDKNGRRFKVLVKESQRVGTMMTMLPTRYDIQLLPSSA
ncbi:MAG: hypothetical protein WAX89_00545 [Alphaproteobacteria bacterium]